MLIQILSRVFIVLDYQINKDYITQFLCINKSKPELNCQGHCYLQKQLKKADQPVNQSTERTLKSDLTLFVQAYFTCSFTLLAEIKIHYAGLITRLTSKYLSPIFHPPLLQLNYLISGRPSV